jgi:4-hydroxythreonine-4-phosphate dehydrogenase
VTIGDPAGIGPDIILMAYARRKQLKLPPFFVVGDAALLTRRAMALDIALSTSAMTRDESPSPFATALPVIALQGALAGKPGQPSQADAPHIVEAIRIAVSMARAGEASAVVTCPVAKSSLYGAGFPHPGQTEYLAALAAAHDGVQYRAVMMIASDRLRTVPVTIHIPLERVAESLSVDLVVETAEIVAADLRKRFGIARPRLALSGFNPHAGENGALGSQENEIISPAIARLRGRGLDVTGPYAADTLFHEAARQRYDVAICMYHDQALIPAKTLAFDDGVNVTLGLPFIRTSPDHGTAFDIAGTGRARSDSFIAALRMAEAMALAEQPG